jgi:hypothetical protein
MVLNVSGRLTRDRAHLASDSRRNGHGWSEDMQSRLPDGTFDRIAAVLNLDEDRTDFIRTAVQNWIADDFF